MNRRIFAGFLLFCTILAGCGGGSGGSDAEEPGAGNPGGDTSSAVSTISLNPNAGIFHIVGLAVDPTGQYLYIMDEDNSKIMKMNTSTHAWTTVGNTDHVSGSITIDSTGQYLYIADSFDGDLIKMTISTGAISTIPTGFYSISGIAIDPTNQYLYVSDDDDNQIFKVNLSTNEKTEFAGSGSYGIVDGVGTAAKFLVLRGMTIDSEGKYLYVSDGNAIRQITISTAEVSTLAGSAASGFADGTGTAAGFYYPDGLAVDKTGKYLYVCDTSNYELRKVVIATGEVTTLAGSRTTNEVIDGTGSTAGFYCLEVIAVDPVAGSIYAGDGSILTGCLRKIK